MSILIADDHDAVMRGVRSIIESSGRYCVIGTARNGREALQLATELQPDVAILDYSLPELNGLDLARAMMRECPGTEILIFSVHDEQNFIEDVLRAGVRGFVTKSDSEQHLVAALEALSMGRPYLSPTVSDALLDRCLQSEPRPASSLLTSRERETTQLVAEGWTNKQIALHLGITLKTVETHRASAMRKLKLRTTASLVRWAIRNNLAQP